MANASNFTRGFTPASNPERGKNILWATQLAFIYVKMIQTKNNVTSYLRVPIVRNDQCNPLPPDSNPKRGNKKGYQTVSRLPFAKQ